MKNLRELYLSDNLFEGALDPFTFAECNELRVVHLERNYFEADVPFFRDMHKLEFVFLHQNRFSMIQSNTFSNSTSLQIVNLANQERPDGVNGKLNLKERAFADIPISTSLILLGYVALYLQCEPSLYVHTLLEPQELHPQDSRILLRK